MVSYVPQSMDHTLRGGYVQRLVLGRLGAREVTLLQVRVPGETVHVLVASGHGVGLIDGVTRERLREGLVGSAPPHQAHWRSRIEGARLAYAADGVVGFTRGGTTVRPASNDFRTLTLSTAPTDDPETTLDRAVLRERGIRIAEALLLASTSDRRDALRRALTRAVRRIERRIEAIGHDLTKMAAADRDAQRAQLFVAAAARAPRGTTSLRTFDWSTGTPKAVELTLDPAKSPQEQITRLFKRARRMKDGVALASGRLQTSKDACDNLQALIRALTDPATSLDALEASARAVAPRDFKRVSDLGGAIRGPAQDTARRAYRKFVGATGFAILVGRGASQNDALTMRIARPHDLWLHAKGWTGAHVVVPLVKGASCPPDVLVEAAHLAAHFSVGRGESFVDVLYTPRRYVRKTRASAPGEVSVDRERVIVLRRSDDILRKLLECEAEA
jgi:hypothetical protein